MRKDGLKRFTCRWIEKGIMGRGGEVSRKGRDPSLSNQESEQ